MEILARQRPSWQPEHVKVITALLWDITKASCCGGSIARAYSVFAEGGKELGLSEKTLKKLIAPATPPRHGFFDEVMKGDVQFSLGFMKPSVLWSFGGPSSFGFPGAGGSMGFADPTAGIGYAYVTSQMGTALTGDPREVALRSALYAGLQKL